MICSRHASLLRAAKARCQAIGAVAFAVLALPVFAASLQVTIQDTNGQPVRDVVIIANSSTPARAATQAASKPVVMDQINKEFVPEVLVIRVGTSVAFPNTDSVAHQVYSFSPTKRFSLPLYRGRPYPPVIFDSPGVVTLGCNIHDHMVGYIVVTDTPHFGQTDAQGHVELRDMPNGTYNVSAWHPRFSENVKEESVTTDAATTTLTFKLSKPMRPAPRASTDKRVRDY